MCSAITARYVLRLKLLAPWYLLCQTNMRFLQTPQHQYIGPDRWMKSLLKTALHHIKLSVGPSVLMKLSLFPALRRGLPASKMSCKTGKVGIKMKCLEKGGKCFFVRLNLAKIWLMKKSDNLFAVPVRHGQLLSTVSFCMESFAHPHQEAR